jgi:hypothetical protein
MIILPFFKTPTGHARQDYPVHPALANKSRGWRAYQAGGGQLTLREWIHARVELTEKLQAIVDEQNRWLASNAHLALDVRALSSPEFWAAKRVPWLKKVFYGRVLERLVRDAVGKDTNLRTLIAYAGTANRPDFVGKGRYSGLNFDITTERQSLSHLARKRYGDGLLLLNYSRPREFRGF